MRLDNEKTDEAKAGRDRFGEPEYNNDGAGEVRTRQRGRARPWWWEERSCTMTSRRRPKAFARSLYQNERQRHPTNTIYVHLGVHSKCERASFVQ